MQNRIEKIAKASGLLEPYFAKCAGTRLKRGFRLTIKVRTSKDRGKDVPVAQSSYVYLYT